MSVGLGPQDMSLAACAAFIKRKAHHIKKHCTAQQRRASCDRQEIREAQQIANQRLHRERVKCYIRVQDTYAQ